MNNKSLLKKLKHVSIGSAMADLAMLLLIFFMASTSTEPPKGVEVELPKAEAQGAEQDSLFVSISKEGDIYFDGKPVDIQGLNDKLAMRQGEKDRIISITADKNLDYKLISNVLVVLQKQDFLNIVFMAESRKSDSPTVADSFRKSGHAIVRNGHKGGSK